MAGSATSWSTQAPAGTATADDDRPVFATALRGYERNQVDDHLDRRDKELAALRSELAELRSERDRAVADAESKDQELREARAKSARLEPAAKEDSFGFRAEKLLRMAEQEAADIRSSAGRESSSIVEKARTDAEAHRHEVEQTLITRASLLEQQAAKRSAALQEREQQIGEQLTAAREQAEQLQANAARAAERLREESEEAAEQTRQRADADARRRLDEAGKEIARLRAGGRRPQRARPARAAHRCRARVGPGRPGWGQEPPPHRRRPRGSAEQPAERRRSRDRK